MLYLRGDGVEQDESRARALFARACDAGFREACGRARE
jgi:TPR repeat protein